MQTKLFRQKVYQSMLKRAEEIMDLVDALTVTGRVDSPITLSEGTPFRRKFSSIFNTLRHGEIDIDLLLSALHEYQPTNSEKLVGYEAYGLDSTPNEREEAETLEDRVFLKAQKEDPVCLRSNLEFYKRPKPHLKGAKGAPAKHVASLSSPSHPEHLTEPKLSCLANKLANSKPGKDCTSRNCLDRSDTVPLEELCRMYLWRFAIEHMFRSLKQHMGLNANKSTDPVSSGHWMWLCALAYWQLLLLRDEVKASQQACYPAVTKADAKS